VFAPDPAAVRDGDWCARLLPRTAHVYADTARLWLTAAALFLPGGVADVALEGRFRPVEDARRLLDAVYPEGSFGDEDPVRNSLPAALRGAFDAAMGKDMEDRKTAARRCLQLGDGWLKSWPDQEVDDRNDDSPPTRLGELHEVVLLGRGDGNARLLGEDLDGAVCRVPQQIMSDEQGKGAREELLRSNSLSGPDKERLRWRDVVLLQQDGCGSWRGTATRLQRRGGEQQVRVAYCCRYGLRLEPA
jgi:hypothetical protein